MKASKFNIDPAKLKEARGRLDLKQAAFASKVGVSEDMVSKWETGKASPPRNRAAKIAEVLGIPISELEATPIAVGGTPTFHRVGPADLLGRWEGWYLEELDGEILPTAHEIGCTDTRLHATAWGKCNKSVSKHVWTEMEPASNSISIWWTYSTTNRVQVGADHSGIHVLHLIRAGNVHLLEGEFFNSRLRSDGTTGCGGRIILRRAEGTSKNCLDFDTDRKGKWAIPEPPKTLVDALSRIRKSRAQKR